MNRSIVRGVGLFADHGQTDGDDRGSPFSELSLTFVPLALVAEWRRCSETADFVGRFFAHDYPDREVAGSVLSTIANELVENAVKFASDKSVAARIVVREYDASLTMVTENIATPAQADLFAATIARLVDGDPERMFAEQIAQPPATGGAGIGLIMLRKDYNATIGARMSEIDGDAIRIEVAVSVDNREMGAT